MAHKNLLKFFTLSVLLALTNEVKARSSPSPSHPSHMEVFVEDGPEETFSQDSMADPEMDGSQDRSDPINIIVEDVPSNQNDVAGSQGESGFSSTIVDLGNIAQPLTDAFSPILNAISPVSNALNTPISETLMHFGSGTKDILKAKATLAAPFVKAGSLVAAPFLGLGAKAVGLAIKGGKLALVPFIAKGKLKAALIGKHKAKAALIHGTKAAILAGNAAVLKAPLVGGVGALGLGGAGALGLGGAAKLKLPLGIKNSLAQLGIPAIVDQLGNVISVLDVNHNLVEANVAIPNPLAVNSQDDEDGHGNLQMSLGDLVQMEANDGNVGVTVGPDGSLVAVNVGDDDDVRKGQTLVRKFLKVGKKVDLALIKLLSKSFLTKSVLHPFILF